MTEKKTEIKKAEPKKIATKDSRPQPKFGIERLQEPITWDEIEWRIGTRPKKEVPEANKKTQILPYINNRCVLDRFDEAFGWDGWQNAIKEGTTGYLCTLKIWSEESQMWIEKTDGASKTNFEPDKGGISDAMKRAAGQFGLGRILYRYPKVYMKGDHAWIPKWAVPQLRALTNFINNPEDGKPIPPVIVMQPKPERPKNTSSQENQFLDKPTTLASDSEAAQGNGA